MRSQPATSGGDKGPKEAEENRALKNPLDIIH
jgi:hypothetical protein